MVRYFNSCRGALLIVLGALCAWAPSRAFAAISESSYHIGNSLTVDMVPTSFPEFAAQRGLTHAAGRHIRTGSTLEKILSLPYSPSDPPVSPFGTFTYALPRFKWNAVTIQPHPGIGSTMATDVESILSVISLTRSNYANFNTRFYIYSTWPTQGDYHAKWNAPVVDEDTTPTTRAREYFVHLLHRVRARTDATVLMVPVGDVLSELETRLAAGKVPGYTDVSTFYRDNQHLSPALGRYTAAATGFSTIRAEYPIGLVRPNDTATFGVNPPNAAAIYAAINEAIRDVVGAHLYTGLQRADFDRSGVVDEGDLVILQQAMDKSGVADGDRDGDVDASDLLLWQRDAGLSRRETSPFNPADINLDGFTDHADMEVWQQSAGLNTNYDVDQDGDTDGQDLLTWQRNVTEPFAGDFNRDYAVDGADLALWTANEGFNIRADANSDGLVNQDDYVIWQQEEGRTWLLPFPEASAVPEPAAHIMGQLALLASLAAVRPRRRRLG